MERSTDLTGICKTCARCKQSKDLSAFNAHPNTRDKKDSWCRVCKNEAGKSYRLKNPERQKEMARTGYAAHRAEISARRKLDRDANIDKYRAMWRKGRLEYRGAHLIQAARKKSNTRNWPFDLDVPWVQSRIDAGRCEMTGILFDLGPPNGYRANPLAPSLDRKNPKGYYTKDNCQVVCWFVNHIKSEWSKEDAIRFATLFLKHADKL